MLYSLSSYRPLFRNPHLATIAASYWPRPMDERRFPVEAKLFRPEHDVQVLIHKQQPPGEARGDVVMVHGLEGSADSPYMRSLAQTLLEAGYATHRMNIRTCGGTEFMCNTFYHAGLTTDLFAYVMDLDRRRRTPAWVVGFSLGGNMALKLAGEMEWDATRVLAGVVAVSAPVDLKSCAMRLGERRNWLYQRHFLRSMRKRLEMRREVLGNLLRDEGGLPFRSVYEFDDIITGPAFGFDGADHYYQTQSANQYTHRIEVPALVVASQDDPLIAPEVYEPLRGNSNIELLLTTHGGHCGFLGRGGRNWLDEQIRDWISNGRA